MNYTKPEVAVLGEAVCVIESFQKPGVTHSDGINPTKLNAAYDLDE
jgi:hypothetical protein